MRKEGKYGATGPLVFYTIQYSAFIQRGAVNDKFPYILMLCTLLESQPTMIHSRGWPAQTSDGVWK